MLSETWNNVVSLGVGVGGTLLVLIAFRFFGARGAAAAALGLGGIWLFRTGEKAGAASVQQKVDRATKKAVATRKEIDDESEKMSDASLDSDNLRWLRDSAPKR